MSNKYNEMVLEEKKDKRDMWLAEFGRKELDVLIDSEDREYINDENEDGFKKIYLPEELEIIY